MSDAELRGTQLREAPLILLFTGNRHELLGMFRLADHSDSEIARYINEGFILIALVGGELVGHLQMIEAVASWRINCVAVIPSHRGRGIASALVDVASMYARACETRWLEVAAASADVGVLRFFQRLGFRMARIERDVFNPAAGYSDDATVGGVRVLDRVWLDRAI